MRCPNNYIALLMGEDWRQPHRYPRNIGGLPLRDLTLNGHAYVGGNLVATALRSARGRPQTDIRCDCCGRPEALSHILQSCPRTHASRIARHDKIIDLVISCAEKIGYGICHEPAIPTPAGIRKPDLILVPSR